MAMSRQDRIGRKEFAIYLLILMPLAAIAHMLWAEKNIFILLPILVVAAGKDRVHDLGQTSWWLLIPCVALMMINYWKTGGGPLVIAVVACVVLTIALGALLLLPGQPGANRYGQPVA